MMMENPIRLRAAICLVRVEMCEQRAVIIFVDADACPVKNEIIKVAERYGLVVKFVANSGMRPSRDPMIQNIVVSSAFDAADDWIVEQAQAGDVAITADVPLAEQLVKNGVLTTGPTGKEFNADTIGMQRGMRDFNQYMREAGEISGHNAPFSSRNRSDFLQTLDRLILQAQKQRN